MLTADRTLVEAGRGHLNFLQRLTINRRTFGGLFFRSLLPLSVVKMPNSPQADTHMHTLPPRRLYQRKGVCEINQCNDKDRTGESIQPNTRFSDMTSAVSHLAARFMNAAAQVWGVAELVSLICTWCCVPTSESCATSIAQPRLVNLARVSRFVSDAALRQLWRDLPSMRPLLSLLPSDLVDLHFDTEWNPATSPLPVSVTILRRSSTYTPRLGCEAVIRI